MSVTRSYVSPAYVQRDACITRSAGYLADREEILDLAAAVDAKPSSVSGADIQRLAATVETLDTLVVQYDLERSADRRSIAALQRQLAESERLGTESHRALLAERDRSQALALELEAARDNLRDANAMLASALAEALRMQTVAAESSRQLALRDYATMGAKLPATRLERSRAKTMLVVQNRRVVEAYRSQSMVFDTTDTDVIDEPVVGRDQTRRIPVALDGFDGGVV